MSMISLVRATEPEKAQNANRGLLVLNCSLEILYQLDLLSNSFWKKGSQRVRIPYDIRTPSRSVRCLESRTLEMVR